MNEPFSALKQLIVFAAEQARDEASATLCGVPGIPADLLDPGAHLVVAFDKMSLNYRAMESQIGDLRAALLNLCANLNERGEFDEPEGSDRNTSIASAYHRAVEALERTKP